MNKAIAGAASAAPFKLNESAQFHRANILTGADFNTARESRVLKLVNRLVVLLKEKGDPSVF